MVDWRAEFDEAILRICSYTALDDKFPKEYLPGVFLLPKEMHMLEIILHHPRLNATELSCVTGTPKGTVSKMTRSFAEKGLIEIFKSNGNLKEVHYRCTGLGRKLCDAHSEFHRIHGIAFYNHFESLDEAQKDLIVDILCRYADHMKEYTDERIANKKQAGN